MRNGIDVTRRTLGVYNEKDHVAVNVWAPLAKTVELVLPGTEQTIALQKVEREYWTINTAALRRGDTYQFVIDGNSPLPDPVSLAQPDGVHGPSQVVDVDQFIWTDQQWVNPLLEEYIVYELHTGTFTEAGDFKGIEERLDYLVQLGITAIEIMPVAQFPGGRNWGYDGVYPFAVQNSYGGAEGLQRLVNACHQKGIAVVLDVVYNHLGPEGNYLGSYGPYFTDKYKTPWGGAINFDDAYCDGVRRYFIENALMWFRDFHIDALRLDAVHAIKDLSPVHILKEIKIYTDQLMQHTGRQHYLITELDLNDNRYINELDKGGYGMDAQWIDEFHHALRVTAGGDKTGYYEDFNGIKHLAKAYKDAYVYDGQYSDHRKKTFGIKADNNEGKQFIVFSQNHDQVGNRMLGERSSQLFSFDMQKLMAGAVWVSPYIPMLFMGEEYAEEAPFQYFVSHTDPELAAAVRKGRKEEFAAFHAEGEAPDPVSEETFQRSRLNWNSVQQGHHQQMWQYYQTWIQLRKQQPVLKSLSRTQLSVSCHPESNTLTLLRWHDDQQLYCVLNFSKEQQALELPSDSNEWQKLIASSDKRWGGKEDSPETVRAEESESNSIKVQPESIVVYASKVYE